MFYVWYIEDDDLTRKRTTDLLNNGSYGKHVKAKAYKDANDCLISNKGVPGPELILVDASGLAAIIGVPLHHVLRPIRAIMDLWPNSNYILFSAMGKEYLSDLLKELRGDYPGINIEALLLGRNFHSKLKKRIASLRSAP